jgi:hypothetical protein
MYMYVCMYFFLSNFHSVSGSVAVSVGRWVGWSACVSVGVTISIHFESNFDSLMPVQLFSGTYNATNLESNTNSCREFGLYSE